MIEPPLQPPARRKRRTLFAAIGVVAGFVLIGLELIRPGDTSTAERWFWFVVGVLLIGVGLAELRSPRGR